MTMPNITIPLMQLKGDSSTNMIYGKMIQDIATPKPEKLAIPKISRSLLDTDPEMNTDFEDNSPF